MNCTVQSRYALQSREIGKMSNVLDDVTDDTIDARHVCRRVDDWEARVKHLYATVSEWLPDGWTARAGAPVRMHEELMRRFDLTPRQIPTLLLANGSGKSAVLEPRVLWIIGANGRIDMKCGTRHYFIVDLAGNFEAPQWQAANVEQRLDRVALTESWFKQALP